jgi:hypothetical protein
VTEFRKELVSKDGRVVVATSPREFNDLVYGGGYVEKQADKAKTQASPPKPKAESTP